VLTVSQAELLEGLELRGEGALVVPHARAARGLRAAYGARKRARGVEAWEAPAILSWGQWTGSLWSELVVAGAEERLLLNPAQELSLWREIVAEDAAVGAMGSGEALAELARSGWALAAGYGAISRLRSFAATHDSRVFAEWAEAFSRGCGAKGYLSAAMLDEALRVHVERGTVGDLGTVELVGFGEKTPAQEGLLEALRARGTVVVERWLAAEAVGLRAAVVAGSEREELELAARWVRGLVLERPEARVAVVVPHLGEERAELEEVLRETLAPELLAVGEDLSSTPWEFSSGPALGSVAMIADALAVARWVVGALPVQRASALVLSPYVGSGAERDASARFDAGTLRTAKLLRQEIGIEALLAMVEVAEKKQGCAFLPWLRGVRDFLKRDGDRSRPRRFAEWMELVRGVVQAAGWPGDRALTAMEFEATRGWESALDTVSTLDFSGRRVRYAEALEALEMQAKSSLLALPATGAAVEVMEVREAEGSVFDAVVFLRATDANWPPTERVHPLLPWGLQRSLKMAGSDAAEAAERARRFMQGLMERAGSVLFTSAAEDADGKLRPSPLLAEIGLRIVGAEELVASTAVAAMVELESVVDAEQLPALPSTIVKGGSNVLKLQAACGFKAFAELRLLAREPESGVLGLDARESGSLLHRTMQAFWKAVRTQEALRAMSRSEREERLTDAIDAAMRGRLRAESDWDRAYVGVLKQRFRSVLQQWLDEELRRGAFEVIDSEQKAQIAVGPLMLDVRMDRIDRVDGGFFLVDYKSGSSGKPKDWEGERPDDPQLLLYAKHYQPEELRGLAFAKVRAGEDMKWVGYQAERGILPVSLSKNVRDLGPLIEEWNEVLTRLAYEFAEGRADVLPKSFKVNCSRCAVRLLCRVDPLALPVEADAEEGEDADV
jgi:ATP-dependent helicase/nuclease subunit B